MKDLIEKILDYLPRYLLVFGVVFSGPKKFIAERRLNAEEEWGNALLFLAISATLVAIVATLTQAAGKDLWSQVAGTALGLLIAVTLGATSVRISWWLVGGRADAQSFFITYAYTFGVVIIIFVAFQVLGVGVFKMLDPDLHAKALKKQATESELTSSTVYLVVLAINIVGFLVVSLWGFIAWGAYRQLNGLSKFRSSLALMIQGVLSIPIAAAVFFVVSALTT